MENLEAKVLNLDFSTLKLPSKISERDKSLVEAFKELAPLYWCLAEDYPAKVKLILALNHWMNVPMALLDMAKLVENKRLSSALSKYLNHLTSRFS